MPLNIDIALRWGKKKDGKDEKDEKEGSKAHSPTSSAESSSATSQTVSTESVKPVPLPTPPPLSSTQGTTQTGIYPESLKSPQVAKTPESFREANSPTSPEVARTPTSPQVAKSPTSPQVANTLESPQVAEFANKPSASEASDSGTNASGTGTKDASADSLGRSTTSIDPEKEASREGDKRSSANSDTDVEERPTQIETPQNKDRRRRKKVSRGAESCPSSDSDTQAETPKNKDRKRRKKASRGGESCPSSDSDTQIETPKNKDRKRRKKASQGVETRSSSDSDTQIETPKNKDRKRRKKAYRGGESCPSSDSDTQIETPKNKDRKRRKKASVNRSSSDSGTDVEERPTQLETPKNKDRKRTKSPASGSSVPKEEKDVSGVSSATRKVILVRDAERVDRVFPSWIRLTSRMGSYQPVDLNLPTALPKRRGGLKAFEEDPPITQVGRAVADLTGMSVKRAKMPITVVFCSPALRCVQTAQQIVGALGIPELTIKVEPGLFDWCGWYDIFPNFMTTRELREMGVPVDQKYTPAISRERLMELQEETKHDYYRRAQDIVTRLLTVTQGAVLIVGHAVTIDATARPLLGLPKSVPAFRHLDRMADHYPYCSSVVLEQSEVMGSWNIGQQLLPTTFIDLASQADLEFLKRN